MCFVLIISGDEIDMKYAGDKIKGREKKMRHRGVPVFVLAEREMHCDRYCSRGMWHIWDYGLQPANGC